MAYSWLLLHYKVPREPTSSRVYVWRKLKRIGALLLHDSIWVLPQNPRTLEQLQWLAAEIGQLEGEATLWDSRLVPGGTKEETLVGEFEAQVDTVYAEILAELQQNPAGGNRVETEPVPDLEALSRRYQQAVQTDFFHSRLGQRVREALEAAREGIRGGGTEE